MFHSTNQRRRGKLVFQVVRKWEEWQNCLPWEETGNQAGGFSPETSSGGEANITAATIFSLTGFKFKSHKIMIIYFLLKFYYLIGQLLTRSEIGYK